MFNDLFRGNLGRDQSIPKIRRGMGLHQSAAARIGLPRVGHCQYVLSV